MLKSNTKKENKTKFTEVLMIRVSPEQKQILHDKAERAGVSISDLIRNSILEIKVYRADRQFRGDLSELSNQIRMVGKNMNQIAKWVNIYKSEAHSVIVIQRLLEIQKILNAIYSLVSRRRGGGKDAD